MSAISSSSEKLLLPRPSFFATWLVLAENFTGVQSQLFQQAPEVRFGQARFKVVDGFKFRPAFLQQAQGRPALGAGGFLVTVSFFFILWSP
jgi:hypothetical protein